MTFEQLFHFAEVYRQESITKAAEILHISRQCLSKSISKIEDELELILFERNSYGVTATPAAKELYNYATNIFTEYVAMKKEMLAFSASNQIQAVSIGIPEIHLAFWGEQFIDDISAKFTSLDFIVQVTKKDDIPKIYSNYDIIYFSSISPVNMDFKGKYQLQFISKRPLCIWVKKNSPLSQITKLNISVLKEYPFCVLRNTFNWTNFVKNLNIDYNIIVDTKKNFRDKLLNNYYTFDAEIQTGKFYFSDILSSDEFELLQTENFMYSYLLFKANTNPDLIDFLVDYFCS